MFGVGAKKESKGYKCLNLFLAIFCPLILILLWQRGVDAKVIKAALLPAPKTLWSCFLLNIKNGKLIHNLFISFSIVLRGFFMGAVLAIVLGFLMGLFKPFKSAFSILISVLRPIPIVAIVPIFILFLGIGDLSKASVIAVGSFWPIFMNTINGIQNTDRRLLEVAYTYRISKIRTVFQIVLPSAVPMILTGVRLGISSAWMSVVAAEMIAASEGIGYLITISKEQAMIPLMYVSVLVIGLVGLLIDKLIGLLEAVYLRKTRGTVK
jgi:sulfonate transport system permease protein